MTNLRKKVKHVKQLNRMATSALLPLSVQAAVVAVSAVVAVAAVQFCGIAIRIWYLYIVNYCHDYFNPTGPS